MRRIVDECCEEARRRLREQRDRLDALAQSPLENETLDGADACRTADITRLTEDGPGQGTRATR
ncbi:hypothetical protein D9753_10045 [Streptomyces dangxiongensis]|uniref:Uncharacterized protein n=1 Tax=Streptomyces dangxiongensis TaxID=1442032 RepID=A0A3G2JA59_9ACTN|nr:hypothetical protein D9753_10045 [Streptomyces dangxiongensis]